MRIVRMLAVAGVFGLTSCAGGVGNPVMLEVASGTDIIQAEVLPEAGVPDLAPGDVGDAAELVAEVAMELDVGPDICQPNCTGLECGDDGCGGSCGECDEFAKCSEEGLCVCLFETCGPKCCAAGEVCFEGTCCKANCEGKECGDDGCGGSCGECARNFVCGEDFTCVCAFESCGETCCGENEVCTPDGCCQPQCEGKECGHDGCGGTCGECGDFEVCSESFECVCTTLECGGECCSPSAVCFEDACCEPNCIGKECGDDGCGGSCGECDALKKCNEKGVCECSFVECNGVCCEEGAICFEGACCTPDCAGKECGPDGCGGECGECDPGCYCGGGVCIGSCGVCVPDCVGKECGWDGCGGSCGTCKENEHCSQDTWLCEPGKCAIPAQFKGQFFKINFLKAGKDGHEGEAVDVDNDPTTCAPANMCDGGRDNEFGALLKSLAPLLGPSEPIQEAVEKGDIVILLELVEPKEDGTPFIMNLYRGVPVLPKTDCDFQAEECEYYVNSKSFVPETCLPITVYDNCQISGNMLTAGGPGYNFEFPFILALTGGTEVKLPATHAKVVANVTFDEEKKITGMSGILGCAVPKAKIIQMISDMPDDALPVKKELVIAVLKTVVKPDIDADGDGVDESVSTGLKFKAIPAKAVGVAQ